jgi:hypothetical protein
MTDEQLAYESERRARQGRPPRPYNPKFLSAIYTKYNELRVAERAFLKSIDDAIASGVPLRTSRAEPGYLAARCPGA